MEEERKQVGLAALLIILALIRAGNPGLKSLALNLIAEFKLDDSYSAELAAATREGEAKASSPIFTIDEYTQIFNSLIQSQLAANALEQESEQLKKHFNALMHGTPAQAYQAVKDLAADPKKDNYNALVNAHEQVFSLEEGIELMKARKKAKGAEFSNEDEKLLQHCEATKAHLQAQEEEHIVNKVKQHAIAKVHHDIHHGEGGKGLTEQEKQSKTVEKAKEVHVIIDEKKSTLLSELQQFKEATKQSHQNGTYSKEQYHANLASFTEGLAQTACKQVGIEPKATVKEAAAEAGKGLTNHIIQPPNKDKGEAKEAKEHGKNLIDVNQGSADLLGDDETEPKKTPKPIAKEKSSEPAKPEKSPAEQLPVKGDHTKNLLSKPPYTPPKGNQPPDKGRS